MIEGMRQPAQFATAILRCVLRKIARGDTVGCPGEMPDGT
jgi:hypothetical protein